MLIVSECVILCKFFRLFHSLIFEVPLHSIPKNITLKRFISVSLQSSQVTYVTMVPRVGNETLRPLGVATGNASSVTRV